jgi:hypothetical protein
MMLSYYSLRFGIVYTVSLIDEYYSSFKLFIEMGKCSVSGGRSFSFSPYSISMPDSRKLIIFLMLKAFRLSSIALNLTKIQLILSVPIPLEAYKLLATILSNVRSMKNEQAPSSFSNINLRNMLTQFLFERQSQIPSHAMTSMSSESNSLSMTVISASQVSIYSLYDRSEFSLYVKSPRHRDKFKFPQTRIS